MPTRLTPQQLAIREGIRLYGKLSKRIGLECRVIEAFQLVKVTQSLGTDEQKSKVFDLLNGKMGIKFGCQCDGECEWQDADGCHCVSNASLNCPGLYPFAQDKSKRYYAPAFEVDA